MVLEITPKMDEVMCEMKPYDFDEIFPYGGGSLRGHQLAGSITLLWGIWQSLNVFWYYCASKKSGEPYKSRSWFPLYKYPVEPILKIAIPLFAATMEIYGGFNFHYR